MKSFAIKPLWVGIPLAVVGLAAVIKIALAITAFSPADQPVGYVAQDEMTNYNLRSGREFLFRTEYEREGWSGGLLAYPADALGNVDTVARLWDAGEAIDEQSKESGWSTTRFVATMNQSGLGVPFRYANLSPAQQTDLSSSEPLVNYIRGDRSGEGSVFRTRKHAMGDVIHSRPYYVPDSSGAPTVFVGSNDGMLHAIDASTPYNGGGGNGGQERWGYIPSMLTPKLKKLATEPYVHDYFVDGQINIATILGGTKRVLVGGLGSGGRGLYALNITGSAGLKATSDGDVASKVMWEVTPTGVNYAGPTTPNAYVNLGYTYGTITMARVMVSGSAVDAVIIGNGYNDGLGTYTACSHATPNYANCGGNYAAYLYVINANTGQLIKTIKAGANGTAAAPNGLSMPAAIDSDGDGAVDTVYAGDLNGTMWKFNLTTDTATALLVTSPAQAITSMPGVAVHPNGGFMVTFGTGKMLVPADATDSSVYYVYGVWDTTRANAALISQTIGERVYTVDGVSTRVRRASTNTQPVWTDGAGNTKGWKVALPAGERVVGEGSFIENGRFYFTSYNPTISTTIQSATTTVKPVVQGENWLMELDYLTGGASGTVPFLDLSGDVKLDDNDRIVYLSTDSEAVTDPTKVGKPIPGFAGVSVGKFISIGVLSQPILVQLASLNDTLFNQNPDVTIATVPLGQGVDGGHFDVDIFYGAATAGAAATATITVGTTGQSADFPASLGAISINGVEIMPALTKSDLVKGTDTVENAKVLTRKIANGFAASRSGSTVTITAPVGADYNNLALTIGDGTSEPLVPASAEVPYVAPVTAVAAVRATALITFSGTSTQNYTITNNLTNARSLRVGSNDAEGGAIVIGSGKTAIQAAAAIVSAMANNGTTYSIYAYVGGTAAADSSPLCASQPTNVVCLVDRSSNSNGSNNGRAVTLGAQSNTAGLSFTTSATAGGVTAVAAVAEVAYKAAVLKSGQTNFKPALATTTFRGGRDGTVAGDNCNGSDDFYCKYKNHIHQYDDKYDRTGVNFLNASNIAQNLVNMIPSTSTQFKVLAQNQYLSPAMKLHIGKPSYVFDVDAGYVSVKDYQTSSTLDVTALPTYVRAATATAPVLPIGSLAVNMPVEALTARNWWGNGDVRVGLHPTTYSCVWASFSTRDGNMYYPVIPPANGDNGPGTRGYAAGTTQSTATGARHNGAFTLQLIKANTPNSAIEQNVPGRPEYGWRVKADQFATYVLGEYSIYWHHPNEKCYHSTGWTKTPGPDTGSTANAARAAGSTDPKIGDLGIGNGTITDVTTTIVGNVTTTIVTYSSGLTASIVRTTHNDGSVTVVTIDNAGNRTEQTVANAAGKVKSGGDEYGLIAGTRRISWRELVAP